LDRQLVTDLNVALDEATVQGVRWGPTTKQVKILLCVLALPECGPADPDPRRMLILSGVDSLQVLLRRDRLGTIDYGPPICLPDQQALDDFFTSLAFSDSMYGGKALDDPSPTDDWPARPSLVLRFRAESGPHSFYWFTDCGREEPGGTVLYRLEGLVRFTSLAIERADGSRINAREFADAGQRWWTARCGDDPRVSARAQRELGALSWRD
jgi:hypothetical protein